MQQNNIRRNYSFTEILRLGWYLFRTKLICRKARLLRFPIILRGVKFIDFGIGLTTGYWCRLEAFACDNGNVGKKIVFGNNVQINDYVHISALEEVIIGDSTLIASNVYISDNSHGSYSGSNHTSPAIPPIERPYKVASVKIGKNVWIGEGVFIMPGITIGDGAIIGAHSVVTKDIPENSIAVGSPAKVTKQYNPQSKHWEKV